ncbi:MAG: UDP-N-acetylmuramoyl-L-alanine--D-glutamate ligase [bacterium]|nr:UDP-N-acetylmuramoyl-L-alanine--D-glutamate ligase [bacterium]
MPSSVATYSIGKTFHGKKVLIMGLGRLGGGEGVARFFVGEGAKVTVTDLKNEEELKDTLQRLRDLPISYVLGKHRPEDFRDQDLVIRNPDVPRDSPFLEIARKNKIPVEVDESLFLKLCPVPVIGVTGTRGKTTTTTLIGKILEEAGHHTLLGGNLNGVATLSLLRKITPQTKVVLELSSWQLQSLDDNKLSPHIAVVTNIYPDHLNRYRTMDDYVNDKTAVFKYQKKDDFLVLNQESEITRSFAKLTKSQVVWFKKEDWPTEWHLKIPGEHNRENAAAVLAVGKILGVDEEIIKKTMGDFGGVPYRLEVIRKLNGVTYVNDTTSTTPIAGVMALRVYSGKPIILIAGGNSKNLDLTEFTGEIAKVVKAVVLLEGTATDELEEKLKAQGSKLKILGRFDNFEKAILAAQKVAKPDNIVLLSPGCTSFGMFENEFDRGEQFNRIVRSLT